VREEPEHRKVSALGLQHELALAGMVVKLRARVHGAARAHRLGKHGGVKGRQRGDVVRIGDVSTGLDVVGVDCCGRVAPQCDGGVCEIERSGSGKTSGVAVPTIDWTMFGRCEASDGIHIYFFFFFFSPRHLGSNLVLSRHEKYWKQENEKGG
jgi:hypothetical protein